MATHSIVATASLLGTFQSVARAVLASAVDAYTPIDVQIPHLLGACPDYMRCSPRLSPVSLAVQPPRLVGWNASVANWYFPAQSVVNGATFDFVNEIQHSIVR